MLYFSLQTLKKRSFFTKSIFCQTTVLWGGGGGQGGLNLPLPVPFNPGSRPVFFGSRPIAFFRLRNIAQCCVIFPVFFRFPPPWESRFPPPLLPPPVHLPPFSPGFPPPVPPPPPLSWLLKHIIQEPHSASAENVYVLYDKKARLISRQA